VLVSFLLKVGIAWFGDALKSGLAWLITFRSGLDSEISPEKLFLKPSIDKLRV